MSQGPPLLFTVRQKRVSEGRSAYMLSTALNVYSIFSLLCIFSYLEVKAAIDIQGEMGQLYLRLPSSEHVC